MDSKIYIIASIKSYLHTCIEERRFLRNAAAFCRSPTLDFEHVVFFLLSLPKLSLAVSLDTFLETCFGDSAPIMSKSSMSKARYKVQHTFFIQWGKLLCSLIYEHLALKRWKGHLLFGIDGSTLMLPDLPAIRATFGQQSNQYGKVAVARCLVCYDLLNHFCVRAALIPFRVSELAVAYKWVGRFSYPGIYIFDRGFAGFAHFWLLTRYQTLYVIRCKVGFNTEVKTFVASGAQSSIIELKGNNQARKLLKEMNISLAKSATVTLRLVRVVLDDGTIEVLATNLLDSSQYPDTCFKELYFKRWGVEVFFDEFKNQMQLEAFSGRKPEAIRQEFHAAIFTYNLQSLLLADCQEEIQEANLERATPHKINRNVSFGLFKMKIVQIFLHQNPQNLLANLKMKFLKNTLPVIPNRQNPRKKTRKYKRNKYYTYTNFTRAA